MMTYDKIKTSLGAYLWLSLSYNILTIKDEELKHCTKLIIQVPEYSFLLLTNMSKIADKQMCLKSIKGTEFEQRYNNIIMEKACE